MILKFNQWSVNESASRMPVKEEYWTRKGKIGKKVALYIHDDLDGLFCGIEMKKWLINKGFEIIKYGILNYTDGWKYTTLDPKLINIVLDFANMPGGKRDDDVDYYLDHHGLFTQDQLLKYKNSPVQKKKTNSAYEAICVALGIPQDSLTMDVIDMVDAARYDDYKVSWQRLLNFDISDIKNSKEKRLEFGAAFNQFIKRGDYKTLIEIIHNCNDASIYSIFNAMKLIYPENNIDRRSGIKKDFIEDSINRLDQMQSRTRGSTRSKKIYQSQQEFTNDFETIDKGIKTIKMDGYQIIGDLAFVPTGTWANALRARTIIERDFMDGEIKKEPKFVLLQYGGTLQVCSYKKMENTILPIVKGKTINDLGKYMTDLLHNFQRHLGYNTPDTSIGQDEITVSGGHGGIGSISNIFGTCHVQSIKGVNGIRFIDMFKNKIISDLSGVNFDIGLKWSEKGQGGSKEPDMNYKVLNKKDINKIDRQGKLLK